MKNENLMEINAKDLELKVMAVKISYFEKALALDSTFVLAKQNVEAMQSLESGGKTVQPVMGQPGASPANKQN